MDKNKAIEIIKSFDEYERKSNEELIKIIVRHEVCPESFGLKPNITDKCDGSGCVDCWKYALSIK